MGPDSSAPSIPADSLEAAGKRGAAKAFRRLTWFLVVCYVVAYLDRINIGFANLTMAKDLGLTMTMFGVANSVFYLTYASFEIPSNLMLAKYGARIWIPRIMITWGIASCLTMFAVDQYSLYFLRMLVGAAEAGLLPGVILYLSYWFGARDRARANAFFVVGMPMALLIGAPVSGLILQMDGVLGLHGWQWLFLLEGIPSIIIGVIAYFYLVDGPAKAKWLTDEEKQGMQAALDAEEPPEPDAEPFRWRNLAQPTVLLLAAAYFCAIANANTVGTWTPLVVKELLGNTDDVLKIGLVSAFVPLFTIIAVPLWSWSSDRHNERTFHLLSALGIAASGWVTMAIAAHPVAELIGLILASIGGFSFVGVFWALAVPLLPPVNRPAAIALISMSGVLVSIVGPSVIGILRDRTNSFEAGFWYVAVLNVLGMILLSFAVRAAKRGGGSVRPR